MTEELLYINDVLIELPQRSIARTLQINDLTNLANRQASYSNKIKIPKTANNITTFEMLGITGNTTRLPYETVTVKYVVNGLELVTGGKGIIKQTDSNYNLVIYDGIIALTEALGNSLISELDFSSYNHNLSRSVYFASFVNTSGYIYGVGKFDESLSSIVSIDLQSPSFFVHTLMDMIFASIGQTTSGDIFNESDYKNEVVSTFQGYDRTVVANEIPIDFTLLFGDTKQIDFFKDIIQRYGLMFRYDNLDNDYEFIQYKKLLKTTVNSEDWSDKNPEFVSETYVSSFAQKNILKFKYDDNDSSTDPIFADGNIDINNVNLKNEKTLYTSIMKASVSSLYGIGVAYRLYHWITEDTETVSNEDGIRTFKIEKTTKLLSYDFIGDGLGTVLSSNNTPSLVFEGMTYQDKIDENYTEIISMLDNFKKVIVMCNLSLVDIWNMDFFKLKYFKQFGKYYYLNKVINAKPDTKTKVELIEIGEIIPAVYLVDLTSIQLTPSETELNVCAYILTSTFYHNGAGTYPVVDDVIFEDIGGGEGEFYNGGNLFNKMANGDYIQVSNLGKVLSVQTCETILIADLTSFSIGTGTLSYVSACGIGTPNTLYHNGANAQPEQLDVIYDAAGLNAIVFDGEDKFYELTDGTFIKINEFGVVAHVITCGDKLIADLTLVELSSSQISDVLACAETIILSSDYHDGASASVINGDEIFEDIGGGIASPKNGNDLFYKDISANFSIKIGTTGLVSNKANC